MMWHVLEHLDDRLGPSPTCAARCPGGRLIVAVPNLSSLQARIGGDRWFHQDIPRHRTHFTEGGLLMLLRLARASSRSAFVTSCSNRTLSECGRPCSTASPSVSMSPSGC